MNSPNQKLAINPNREKSYLKTYIFCWDMMEFLQPSVNRAPAGLNRQVTEKYKMSCAMAEQLYAFVNSQAGAATDKKQVMEQFKRKYRSILSGDDSVRVLSSLYEVFTSQTFKRANINSLYEMFMLVRTFLLHSGVVTEHNALHHVKNGGSVDGVALFVKQAVDLQLLRGNKQMQGGTWV